MEATEGAKLRAASGRIITDLDMNGTVRGAVEEFNLASNLRHGDTFFAECIRSYPTVTVNAQEFLHRLEVELQGGRASLVVSRHVPPTSRPSLRTRRSRAPFADAYGFRPLVPELR